jgi:curved DNA-binding protein CbpA
MPNYYEMLKVDFSASTQEIEAAIDEQYHKWRRLITHHDPKVTNQATQALQTLEQIRATLTDPQARAHYDSKVAAEGAAGLTDLEAGEQMHEGLPTLRPSEARSPEKITRLDAWECSRCNTINTVGAQFCASCGQQVGRKCPSCGHMIHMNASHCIYCGVDVTAFIAKKEMEKRVRSERAQQEARLSAEQQALREAEERKRSKRRKIGCMIGCGIFIMFALIAFMILVGSARQFNSALQVSATANAADAMAATATVEASIPMWRGEDLEIRAIMDNVYDDSFALDYSLINLASQTATLNFLTSDIVVVDNLGNIYTDSGSTSTVQETLLTNEVTNFYRRYEGIIDPSATSLNISFPEIGGASEIKITIPVDFSKEDIAMEFSLQTMYEDELRIMGVLTNRGSREQLVRFQADDIVLTDDAGNQYSMEEGDKDEKYMVLLEPASGPSWSRNVDYYWTFVPAAAPEATQLEVAMDGLGSFNERWVLPLGRADHNVRYEAVWREGWGESTRIRLNVFNLGDQVLAVRFDEAAVRLEDAVGNVFVSEETEGRGGGIISPGGSREYDFRFAGLPAGDRITLIFPVFCAQEDVRIPVKVAE